MKRFKTVIAATLFCAAAVVSLVSCSTKDEAPATPAAKSVEGLYKGDMTCSVMGSETLFEDVTFAVSATDDATVSITISSFGEPPMRVSEMTIGGIAVSGSESGCTLAATEFEGTTEDGKVYSGVIRGDFADETLNIGYNLQYGAMPMPMIFSFSARRE